MKEQKEYCLNWLYIDDNAFLIDGMFWIPFAEPMYWNSQEIAEALWCEAACDGTIYEYSEKLRDQ